MPEYRLTLSTRSVILSDGPFKFWLAGAKSGAENLRSRSDLIFPEFSEFADFSQSPHTRPTDLISNPLPAEDSQFQTFLLQLLREYLEVFYNLKRKSRAIVAMVTWNAKRNWQSHLF